MIANDEYVANRVSLSIQVDMNFIIILNLKVTYSLLASIHILYSHPDTTPRSLPIGIHFSFIQCILAAARFDSLAGSFTNSIVVVARGFLS